MFTFIILYFLNLVLDYPLQGTFLAEYKCKNNYILFVHCAIWALGIYIALYFLGLATEFLITMLLIIFTNLLCLKLSKEFLKILISY